MLSLPLSGNEVPLLFVTHGDRFLMELTESASLQQNDTPIEINWEDSKRRVIVKTQDFKDMLLTVETLQEELTEYRKIIKNQSQFTEAFTTMLATVSSWVETNYRNLQSAHITTHGDRFQILIETKGVTYDDTLMESLIRLQMEINKSSIRQFTRINVQMIPEVDSESLDSFVCSEWQLTCNLEKIAHAH